MKITFINSITIFLLAILGTASAGKTKYSCSTLDTGDDCWEGCTCTSHNGVSYKHNKFTLDAGSSKTITLQCKGFLEISGQSYQFHVSSGPSGRCDGLAGQESGSLSCSQTAHHDSYLKVLVKNTSDHKVTVRLESFDCYSDVY